MSTSDKKKFRIGVICYGPSAQLSGQYDKLSVLSDFEFILLFTLKQQDNPAWSPKLTKKVMYNFLPEYTGRLVPARFRCFCNDDIRDVLKKYDFDAIIVHGIYDRTAVWQAIAWCKKNHKPYLLRCDANIAKKRSWFQRSVRYPLISGNVKGAAALLYIGTQNRKFYEAFGVKKEQLFLAPWEIDYDQLEDYYHKLVPKKEELRNQLNLSPDETAICVIGRLVQCKGFDILIPVISKLERHGYKVKLIIGGEGPYKSRIEWLLKEHQANAVLRGNLSRQDVVGTLIASDIFVLPSYREMWGLVVNEASLCGLPIVISDQVGAGPDLIRHEENGFIYPVNDNKLLFHYLERLTIDENLRIHMGENSALILKQWRKNACALEGYKRALESSLKIKQRF